MNDTLRTPLCSVTSRFANRCCFMLESATPTHVNGHCIVGSRWATVHPRYLFLLAHTLPHQTANLNPRTCVLKKISSRGEKSTTLACGASLKNEKRSKSGKHRQQLHCKKMKRIMRHDTQHCVGAWPECPDPKEATTLGQVMTSRNPDRKQETWRSRKMQIQRNASLENSNRTKVFRHA